MKNGYGLKYLYKYFNLPFLHLQVMYTKQQTLIMNIILTVIILLIDFLQRVTLLKQLQINTDDLSVNAISLHI